MARRVAILDIVGLAAGMIGEDTPHLQRFIEARGCTRVRPVFPAVTCAAQATYLTGLLPSQHGIVGNGWYDRENAEHRFWKQSNHLVAGEKIWETLRRERDTFTCSKLFWWFNMYSSADVSITPRPMYPADGRKVFDIYTHPPQLRTEIQQELGPFPFPSFWGPGAGLASSQWIAEAAMKVEGMFHPDMNLIYLPHLDYDLQRYGPADMRSRKSLQEIDVIFGELRAFFESCGVEVIVLSEYGITEVNRVVHLNRIFRHNGWLTVKEELGLEQLDCGASKVFAIADHQVAHVYVQDSTLLPQVRKVLESTQGVGQVIDPASLEGGAIAHSRAGDLIAVADERSWFSYYYWLDDDKAPDFARCVDIHRKCGYDPVELFIDSSLRFPHLKIAAKLQ